MAAIEEEEILFVSDTLVWSAMLGRRLADVVRTGNLQDHSCYLRACDVVSIERVGK